MDRPGGGYFRFKRSMDVPLAYLEAIEKIDLRPSIPCSIRHPEWASVSTRDHECPPECEYFVSFNTRTYDFRRQFVPPFRSNYPLVLCERVFTDPKISGEIGSELWSAFWSFTVLNHVFMELNYLRENAAEVRNNLLTLEVLGS